MWPAGDRRAQAQAHLARLRRTLNNEIQVLRRAAVDNGALSTDGALSVLEGLITDLASLAEFALAEETLLASGEISRGQNPDDPGPASPEAPVLVPSPPGPSGDSPRQGISREAAMDSGAESWSAAWASSRDRADFGENPRSVRLLFYGILLTMAMIGVGGAFLIRQPSVDGWRREAVAEVSPASPTRPVLPVPEARSVSPADETAVVSIPPEGVEDATLRPVEGRTARPLAVPDGVGAVPAGPGSPPSREDVPFKDVRAWESARALANSGDYVEAAYEWERMLQAESPSAYTVLVETDCLLRTLKTQFALFGEDPSAIFKPQRIAGQSCFLLMYGIYDSLEEAEAVVSGFPSTIRRREDAPVIRRLGKVL